MAETQSPTLRIGVVGAGAWGTALAQAAALAGHEVTLLARQASVVDQINSDHRHSNCLPGAILSPAIRASLTEDDFKDCDAIILAVPAQVTRSILPRLAHCDPAMPFILTAKGFEARTLDLQSDIIAEAQPQRARVVLSGPSFAVDVAAARPTAVTLASSNSTALELASKALASQSFRPYGSDDPIGVQVAGALKNVYALAAGAVEGAGLGLSARSALIARAQAELLRMILAMGGKAGTVHSLAGLGDMVLSCTSTQSRNYRFGVELGRGGSVEDIQGRGLGLAEGVHTAPVALELARKHGVDTPLIDAINMVLSQKIEIGEVVNMLMTRPLKQEN